MKRKGAKSEPDSDEDMADKENTGMTRPAAKARVEKST